MPPSLTEIDVEYMSILGPLFSEDQKFEIEADGHEISAYAMVFLRRGRGVCQVCGSMKYLLRPHVTVTEMDESYINVRPRSKIGRLCVAQIRAAYGAPGPICIVCFKDRPAFNDQET
jgi:hypothetical protein